MLSKAKYFLAVLLAVSIFASALPAQAALSAEQQNALLSLLFSFGVEENVITHVGGIVAGVSTSASSGESDAQKTSPLQAYCPNLSVNMSRGARDATTGGQVSELQRFLASYFGLNQSDIVTGYFGVMTQKYVVMLQEKNGLPAYGFVGASTRALIANLCGGSSVSPLCILTSNKPQYVYGQTVTVSWASQNTSYGEWVKDTSGKDNFFLGGDKLPASGSASFVANVIGNPYVTMRVHAPNDATATCSLTIPVSENSNPATTTPSSISASLDASAPGLQFVAAGSENVTVGAFKIANSGSEALKLNTIQLAIDDYNFSPLDIVSLTLWDGATFVGAGSFIPSNINPLGYFDGSSLSSFTIPANSSKVLTVKASFTKIGTGEPGTSGHKLQVTPYHLMATGVTTGAFVEKNYRTDGGAPVSYPAYIFRSFPKVSIGSEKLPYTGVEDGRLLRFAVSADSHGSIGLGKMVFSVQPTNASVTNGMLYGYTDSNFSLPISGFNADGSIPTSYTGSVYVTGPLNPIQIPAGATRYFEFRGSVSPSGSGASVTTRMLSDQNMIPLQSGIVLREKDTNFVWSPNSTTTSSYGASDWTGGYAVPGLPLAGFSGTRVGTASSTATTTAPIQTNPVTASVSVTPASVTSGQSTVISWNSNLTASDVSYYGGFCGISLFTDSSQEIHIDTGGAPRGSVTHAPLVGGFYSLFCTSGAKDGSPAARTAARVSVSAAPSPVISSFTAYPSYISQKGVVTLSWATTNANRCVIQYSGREVAVNTTGTYSAVQYATVDYKLICTNDPGTGKDGPSTSAVKTVPFVYTAVYDTGTVDGTSETSPKPTPNKTIIGL
jgi:hypothetical protein